MSKSWFEIDQGLDPLMPKDQRDQLRQKYFADVVQPRIRPGYSVKATFEDFMKKTERAPLLSGTESLALKTGVAGLVKGALPFKTVSDSIDFIDQKARADGLDVSTRNAVGEFVGQGLALTPLMSVGGGLAGPIAESIFGAGRAAQFAAHVARGGLALGAYDALADRDGDRVAAGIRGATVGALWDAGLGAVFGFGQKVPEKLIQNAINEKLPGPQEPLVPAKGAAPERIEVATPVASAQTLKANVEEARKQGYLTGPMVETPTLPGLRAIVKDAQGMPNILAVVKGKEAETIGQIQEALDNGGSIDGIHFHPASRARAGELMRHFAEKSEAEDTPLRMKVLKGRAESAARDLNKMGLRGTVVDDSTLLVGPEAAWRQAQRSKLAGSAAKTLPKDAAEMDKTMYRIGDIRNRVRMSQQKKGPSVPRAEHQELHHLAGNVGQQFQLTRSEVGQLALRHYEQVAQGNVEHKATDLLERFKGRGGQFGVEPGERPPVGFDQESRIRGFRKATGPESTEWDSRDGELRVRPTGSTKVLSKSSKELGFGGLTEVAQDPVRLLAADATKGDIYHESVHVGAIQAGIHDDFPKLLKGHEETAQGIIKGLKGVHPAYRDMNVSDLANESFVHAAEAIRMNDSASLSQLAKWDTSEEAVKQFVSTTAGRALDASQRGDSAGIRAFQRRMNDLLRRTDPNVTEALQRASVHGFNTWFNPEVGQWVMRDGEGRELLKPDLPSVFDHIDSVDASSHFPDMMNKAYYKGLQGPLVPRGTEPIDGPLTVEQEHVPLGWQAVRSIFQPTLDWASNVQRKLEKYGVDLPFYKSIRDVQDAHRNIAPIVDSLDRERESILKGVSKGKRSAYGEVLATDDKHWPATATALKLDGEDLANIRLLDEWDQRNVREGGVSLRDTLRTMRSVRETGGDVQRATGGRSTAASDAIKNGALGYTDLHVGQVAKWTLRQQFQEHMAEPIKALQKVAQTKTKDGNLLLEAIQYPIRNYTNYMKGIPDQGQVVLNSFVDGMLRFGDRRIAELNKALPGGLQISNFGTSKEALAKYQLLLYTAGLGARPAVFIRDTFQAMQAMAVMGPKAFGEGLVKAMTRAGQKEARDAGALLHGRNIGEFFGDVSGDLPASGRLSDYAVKAADTLLSPSRYGHNIGRSIAYLGEKSQALREIGRYRSGAITDVEDLARRTSVWFQDAPEKSRLLAMAADHSIPIEKVADEFAKSLNDATQFALRSGTQGAVLRTGFGRVFGQYATFPMNYMELMRKLASRAADTPTKGVPALGMWAAMNYGAFESMKAMGVDAGKWLFFSPVGYAGSPNTELLQNLMTAPEESAAGLEARRKLHETPLEFVPTGVEIQSILRAIEDDDVSLPRLLGFKPLPEEQDNDLEDRLEIEAGFFKGPGYRPTAQ